MALLKTWCLLPLAALLLLSIVPTVAEVVGSMSDCAEFFLQQTPPNITGILEGGNILNQNRYKPICQTLNNERSFVTLFDTTNKIPVFSAYKYRGKHCSRRRDPKWMIEPQLEDESDDKNMMVADQDKNYNHQAVFSDYTNSSFDKGHLFPCSYAFTEIDKNSTFTLTNAVPQEKKFNQGSWNRMETCIKCVLDQYCIDSNGFLVTGAQPSTNNILNKEINIPSMLWSAFCCYSHREGKWLASAHWGQNVPDENTYLQTKTLAELQNELSSSGVFPGTECPLNTTVTELYPKLKKKKDCTCPPPISTTSAPPTTTYPPPISTYAPLTTVSGPISTTYSQQICSLRRSRCICYNFRWGRRIRHKFDPRLYCSADCNYPSSRLQASCCLYCFFNYQHS